LITDPEAVPTAVERVDLRKLRYLLLSLAVVVADQWSKWLVEAHLPHPLVQTIVPIFLSFTHVRNTGVAFGLFASDGVSGSWMLTGLGLAALAAVAVYFRFAAAEDRWLLSALALVVGGAVGNLIDRVTSGAVTDFIDVYLGPHHWPAFNVADSAISVGIFLMLLDSLRLRKGGRSDAGAEPESA